MDSDPRLLLTWDRCTTPRSAALLPAHLPVPSTEASPGTVWCRGIIRNRAELARALTLDHAACDRELISALYRQHEAGLARVLRGATAWVHWDSANHRLSLARDRVGIEGLYYQVLPDGTVRVSSEVEFLVRSAPRRPPLNHAALVAHLSGRPPGPAETCYSGISAVPPGGVVTLSPGRTETLEYWRPPDGPTLRLGSDEEYAAAYRELLARVVSAYAPPSPAAVTLSGGLDSSSLAAALIRSGAAEDLAAITLTSPDLPEADESGLARLTAGHLGLRLTSLRFDHLWPLAGDGALTAPDGPFALPYDEAWRAIHRAALELGANVVFAGMGGDELFGGNVFPYADQLLDGRWGELLSEFRAHLARRRAGLSRWALLRGAVLGPLARGAVESWRGPLAGPRVAPWIGARYRRVTPRTVSAERRIAGTTRARHERRTRLLTGELTRSVRHHRRLAAASSIDLRMPLLDHEIVEFALSLPAGQTIRGGVRKPIVRHAMRGWLPDAVLDRDEKTLPTAIATLGLRQREVPRVRRYLTDMKAAEMGLVDQARLRDEYQAYLDGRTGNVLFWHAITLEDWLRRSA